MKIIKILLFVIILSGLNATLQARNIKNRIAENIYWTLDYSINKYGEKDIIKGAYCGKYGLKERIYINKDGITLTVEGSIKDNIGKIKQISFLFNSKTELIVKDIIETNYDGYMFGQSFLIDRMNIAYNDIINNIKKSNYMSILLEGENGEKVKITEVNNKNSTSILNKLENEIN